MAFVNSNDKFLYVNIGAPSAIQACSRQLRTIEADQKLTHYLEGHSLYFIVSLQVMVLKYTRCTK